MRVERALPRSEDIRALASTDLTSEFTAVPGSTDDLLKRHAILDERHDRGVGLLAPQIAVYCSRSAQVSNSGLIIVAPIAVQITRIDRRTAPRKAALAFSIRCQRSATWMTSGSAFAAASP